MRQIYPLLIALISFLVPCYAQAFTPDQVAAKQAYMVDFDTGTVLFSKNEDERMPTSSMSKVMTIFLVFEALESGRLKLDDTMIVSEKAWRTQGSKMFVKVGDSVRVDDLIHGVIVQSGNDAAITLAEGLAGSEDAFANAMNVKAAELGMNNSHFMNASGLPDPDHYSTAHDLTILARAMITRFPEYYKIYSQQDFTYNNIKQGNRNPLLYRNIGADGMKTGHTDTAGYGLIGSGVRNGRRVIFVMNGMKDMQARADEGIKLLDWGLGGFDNLEPYANERTATNARVVMGQTPTVPLIVGNSFKVTVPKIGTNDMKVVAVFKEPLVAPVKKGQQVGSLIVTIRGQDMTLPLVAGADVPSMNILSSTIAKALYVLTGKDF
jgi:serine-type D-Ala-D-Ala carboxypeptidase (penicillin-binding protein 5/6)